MIASLYVGTPCSSEAGASSTSDERWTNGEVSIGLRQRFGHGPYAARLDVYGAVANHIWIKPFVTMGENPRVETWEPVVGGMFGLRNYAIDVAVVDRSVRVGVRLRWPGVVTIF